MSRSELSLSDEWETDDKLFKLLYKKYLGKKPRLDVACNFENCKCYEGIFLAFEFDWIGHSGNKLDVWCNPPHSKTESFVKRADEQWKKHNINILMIVPANSICAHYFDDVFDNNHASYYRISGRPQFLRNGKVSKFPSRNSYFVVIWKKTKRLFN